MKNIPFMRYIETFHVLEKYSEEYGWQLRHLLGEAKDLKNRFSVLDIGAGDGNFAKSFFENCKNRPSDYTAIEPSGEHVKSIKENLSGFSMGKNIMEACFTPRTRLKRKYDLIIMSHSIYHFVPRIWEHLSAALELLGKRGKLIIYAGAPSNFCYLLNLFVRRIAPGTQIPHCVSSFEVTDILDKHKMGYEISCLPGKLNATRIFQSKTKKLMHELITFALYSEAKGLGKKELRKVEELLRILSYKSGDKINLNLAVAAIRITRD